MPNTGIDPLRRVAGIILWHLEHKDKVTGLLNTPQSALAKASKREPGMEMDDLRYALGWAIAARQFRDMASAKWGQCGIIKNDDGTYAPDLSCIADSGYTLDRLIDESGLRPYLDRMSGNAGSLNPIPE